MNGSKHNPEQNCHRESHSTQPKFVSCRVPMDYVSALHQCVNKKLSHGWQCDMIFIKRVVVRYHERASNERVSDITPTRV